MKDNNYFKDRPFDNALVEELDMKSIEFALDEGNRMLEYQLDKINHLRSNCTMILGWLIGAILALTGYVAVEATSEQATISLLVTAGYELAVCFAAGLVLVVGTMYRRSTYTPGDSPSHFFQDSVMEPLKGRSDKSKYTMGWHLHDIQNRIMYNDAELLHEVKAYRTALVLIFSGLILGAVLFAVLILLGV